mgnify:CR=1 FL=1
MKGCGEMIIINAFRVWDIEAGRYLKPDDYSYITLNHDGELLVFDICDNPSILSRSYYKIERFTGFTDMNGCDVYEGDLIIDQHRDQPHRVFFNAEMGCFVAQHDSSLASRNLISAFGRFLEVVGTVHDV